MVHLQIHKFCVSKWQLILKVQFHVNVEKREKVSKCGVGFFLLFSECHLFLFDSNPVVMVGG